MTYALMLMLTAMQWYFLDKVMHWRFVADWQKENYTVLNAMLIIQGSLFVATILGVGGWLGYRIHKHFKAFRGTISKCK